MSIAIAVKYMLKAGVSNDDIIIAISEMESLGQKPRSSAAIRQERYRHNKTITNHNNSQQNVTCDDNNPQKVCPLPDKKKNPPCTPLKEKTNLPPFQNFSLERECDFEVIPDFFENEPERHPILEKQSKSSMIGCSKADFDVWYAEYPHKVGKSVAAKAFDGVYRKNLAGLDVLMQGLKNYIRDKPPDRPWCNPATWLNGQRWLDKPAEIVMIGQKNEQFNQNRTCNPEKRYNRHDRMSSVDVGRALCEHLDRANAERDRNGESDPLKLFGLK